MAIANLIKAPQKRRTSTERCPRLAFKREAPLAPSIPVSMTNLDTISFAALDVPDCQIVPGEEFLSLALDDGHVLVIGYRFAGRAILEQLARGRADTLIVVGTSHDTDFIRGPKRFPKRLSELLRSPSRRRRHRRSPPTTTSPINIGRFLRNLVYAPVSRPRIIKNLEEWVSARFYRRRSRSIIKRNGRGRSKRKVRRDLRRAGAVQGESRGNSWGGWVPRYFSRALR